MKRKGRIYAEIGGKLFKYEGDIIDDDGELLHIDDWKLGKISIAKKAVIQIIWNE